MFLGYFKLTFLRELCRKAPADKTRHPELCFPPFLQLHSVYSRQFPCPLNLVVISCVLFRFVRCCCVTQIATKLYDLLCVLSLNVILFHISRLLLCVVSFIWGHISYCTALILFQIYHVCGCVWFRLFGVISRIALFFVTSCLYLW